MVLWQRIGNGGVSAQRVHQSASQRAMCVQARGLGFRVLGALLGGALHPGGLGLRVLAAQGGFVLLVLSRVPVRRPDARRLVQPHRRPLRAHHRICSVFPGAGAHAFASSRCVPLVIWRPLRRQCCCPPLPCMSCLSVTMQAELEHPRLQNAKALEASAPPFRSAPHVACQPHLATGSPTIPAARGLPPAGRGRCRPSACPAAPRCHGSSWSCHVSIYSSKGGSPRGRGRCRPSACPAAPRCRGSCRCAPPPPPAAAASRSSASSSCALHTPNINTPVSRTAQGPFFRDVAAAPSACSKDATAACSFLNRQQGWGVYGACMHTLD